MVRFLIKHCQPVPYFEPEAWACATKLSDDCKQQGLRPLGRRIPIEGGVCTPP
jgi:hypothetical protein